MIAPRPHIAEMIASQVLFWGVTGYSALLAYRFKHMQNGRMKSLMVDLFTTKVLAFGVPGLYYLLWDIGVIEDTVGIWVRILANVPMILVMIQMDQYVKHQGK